MSLPFSRLCIALASFLICAGWLLSACGELNVIGYLVVLIAGLLMLSWQWEGVWNGGPRLRWAVWQRRFCRPMPLAFLILTAMTLLGSLLYHPNNYDALAYRIPRTLHWIAAGHWHWIHTAFPRLNTRAQGCEWIMAPLLVLLRSERLLWVLNFAAFVAMPGMLFIFLRGCGVAGRVAWYWMWIIPSGYSILFQAGGVTNDLPGGFFAMAAVALALQARRTGEVRDLWYSALAMALASGIKTSNAPLVLPWLIAAWPSLRLFLRRPLATAMVISIAFVVSFLPSAVLNIKYCGDWSGESLELGKGPKPAAWVLASGNLLGLTLQNLTPPVFPLAKQWNAHAVSFLPDGYRQKIETTFQGGKPLFEVNDLQFEEGAGMGFGVTLLLLISAAVILLTRSSRAGKQDWPAMLLRWSPWLALLVFVSKMNVGGIARLTTPYYPFLPSAILATVNQAWLTRQRWWHGLVYAHYAIAACLVVLSPARPLWPAITMLEAAKQKCPGSPLVKRMLTVYSVYRERYDVMAPVREALPKDQKVVGLVSGDDIETSLWRPFGSRRFEHVIRGDTRSMLEAKGITWLVISDDELRDWIGEPLDQWLAGFDAELVRDIPILGRVARGPMVWHIARLRDHGQKPSP